MSTLKKVLIGAGVVCIAAAVALGVSAEEVSAAVTVGIAAGGAIIAVIGLFKET